MSPRPPGAGPAANATFLSLGPSIQSSKLPLLRQMWSLPAQRKGLHRYSAAFLATARPQPASHKLGLRRAPDLAGAKGCIYPIGAVLAPYGMPLSPPGCRPLTGAVLRLRRVELSTRVYGQARPDRRRRSRPASG